MRSRPLLLDEVTKILALQLPTKNEAVGIFGAPLETNFVVYEEKAGNSNEENNAIEMFLQIGCENKLGYRGVAVVELIGHMGERNIFAMNPFSITHNTDLYLSLYS
jgi:hypothetical protein